MRSQKQGGSPATEKEGLKKGGLSRQEEKAFPEKNLPNQTHKHLTKAGVMRPVRRLDSKKE